MITFIYMIIWSHYDIMKSFRKLSAHVWVEAGERGCDKVLSLTPRVPQSYPGSWVGQTSCNSRTIVIIVTISTIIVTISTIIVTISIIIVTISITIMTTIK